MTNSGQHRFSAAFAGMCSLAALATALAAPAAAQTGTATVQNTQATTVPDAPATEDTGADVVVTGSRIARDGFQSPTPLTVLSTEEIENGSPSNNIADFVNQLPSLAGSTRPANSRLNLSSGQAGINALNLRNLGLERTLVLLDGRRSVASTITGVVDVNTIPQALVKSVEVVTGGASAAYGSDAVAGVVNFQLDKKYTGLKISADSGVTTYGDGFNYSADIAAGTAFAGGRGHLLLSGEIAHRDGIFEVDRDWNQTGFVRIQDPNWTATSTSPQFLIRRQVGAANSTPGGLITASAGGTANRLRGLYFGPGGQVLQYNYGALTFPVPSGTAVPALTQGGDWQVNDSGRRIGLDPKDDRYGVFGRASFELSPAIEVFAEAAYNRQKVYFNAGPNLQTGVVLNATGCGTAATAAAAPLTCNAFLYNTLGPARLQGITSVTTATTFADLPNREVDNRRKVQRYAVGAEGDLGLFGKAAPWNIYGQYGRTDTVEQLRNIQNVARLNNATSVAFAPANNTGGYAAGSIQCTINLDAVATNDDRACVPLNRLGLGVADPAAIPYVLGDPFRKQRLQQIVTGVNLSTTPFATWAGDVSIAVGAEYREEKVDGFVPDEFQPVPILNAAGVATGATNRWSVGNYLASKGKFDVKEAYLETVIPLGLGLEFNGAVRATDYSTAGYVTTWKLGATWQPIDDIRIRATRSRDIRAPNLNELFQAGTANSDAVRNPGFPGSSPSFVAAGQAPQASYSYSGFATGNPNLREEKADQWNVGAVFTPSFFPGFNLSVDYFDIDLDQGISTFAAQSIVDLCFQGEQAFCDAITIDAARSPNPAQPYLIIRNQPFNAATQKVRGLDIDAAYRLPLDRLFGDAQGAITLRGLATRYIDNKFDSGVPGTVVLNTVGVNGGQGSTPKWIYRASIAFDAEDFAITAIGRGVSKGKYVANGIECAAGSCPISTTQFPTYESNRAGGLFYADLNLTTRFAIDGDRKGEFFINVTNVFDRDPILVPETGLAANSTYSDLLGRAFRVGVRLQVR